MEKNLRRQSLSKRKLLLALGCILTLLSSCSYPKYKGLLTWDEYYKNSEKRPYILELTAKKGSLVYYGSHEKSSTLICLYETMNFNFQT